MMGHTPELATRRGREGVGLACRRGAEQRPATSPVQVLGYLDRDCERLCPTTDPAIVLTTRATKPTIPGEGRTRLNSRSSNPTKAPQPPPTSAPLLPLGSGCHPATPPTNKPTTANARPPTPSARFSLCHSISAGSENRINPGTAPNSAQETVRRSLRVIQIASRRLDYTDGGKDLSRTH